MIFLWLFSCVTFSLLLNLVLLCRNVSSLVNQLVPILGDSSKAVLLHQICQLLPRQSQDEFDHQAANLLAEGKVHLPTCNGCTADASPPFLSLGVPLYAGYILYVSLSCSLPACINSIQWSLSIVDTIGTQLAVLYREVSLIQRQICTQLYVVGTADSVLIREVSFIQSVLYREAPLYLSFLFFICTVSCLGSSLLPPCRSAVGAVSTSQSLQSSLNRECHRHPSSSAAQPAPTGSGLQFTASAFKPLQAKTECTSSRHHGYVKYAQLRTEVWQW